MFVNFSWLSIDWDENGKISKDNSFSKSPTLLKLKLKFNWINFSLSFHSSPPENNYSLCSILHSMKRDPIDFDDLHIVEWID